MSKELRIAIDFDGTIVEHKYPKIGKEIPGAFKTLRALAENGHKLILWTYRDGEELQAALDFCMENGIMFWAVNKSYPEEEFNKFLSRKIDANIYIDDKNFGGFPGWDSILESILPDELPKTKKEKRRMIRKFKNHQL
jgi:hydroxymethylpyrimidine pyrophosphatase-like HAD family hydrolase